MKTILVATDFSSTASNAGRYAADMARAIDAEIILLHIYQMPIIYSEVPAVMNEKELMQNSQNYLNRLKDDLNRRTGNKLSIKTIIKTGEFFNELKDFCEEIKPYTVVMGSQGTTAMERIMFGSHTINAMKHLMWPLITVPPYAGFSSIKKIGLACDMNDVEETTPIDEIKTLIKDFNAELHILNTGREEVFDPEIVFESDSLRHRLKDIKPHFHFISNNNTDEDIIKFTEKNKIDMLVVLPKRRNLMEQLMHRSFSKQMILHSHVPVMAFHHQY